MIRGIGIDVAAVERFRCAGEVRDLFGAILTEGELARIRTQHDAGRHAARIFAVKEAALKALGVGLNQGTLWRDMEVTEDDTLMFTGALAQATGVHRIGGACVSWSWSRTHVVAVVVLE